MRALKVAVTSRATKRAQDSARSFFGKWTISSRIPFTLSIAF